MEGGHTHIAVILDRSGSMEDIREETIGGFNAFLRMHQGIAGRATLTLVQFDSVDPYEVFCRFKPIQEVRPLTPQAYVPRGGTPLLDVVGRSINDLEQQIMEMPADARPARMIFVVITDGRENASQGFSKEQVEAMIRAKQDEAGWQFVFLSADLAAINDALASGVRAGAAMAFDKGGEGTSAAWASLSNRVSDVRSSRARYVEFTEEDRSHHRNERRRRKKKP